MSKYLTVRELLQIVLKEENLSSFLEETLSEIAPSICGIEFKEYDDNDKEFTHTSYKIKIYKEVMKSTEMKSINNPHTIAVKTLEQVK